MLQAHLHKHLSCLKITNIFRLFVRSYMFAAVVLIELKIITTYPTSDIKNSKFITKQGNIFNYIFLPLCINNRTQPQNALLLTEIIKYATLKNNELIKEYEKYNNNSHLGIKYGYVLHDTCGETDDNIKKAFLSPILGKIQTNAVNKDNLNKSFHENYFLTFLGHFSKSLLDFAVAVLAPYRNPVISLSLDSPQTYGKAKYYRQIPGFDMERASILVDLFEKYNWKYTAVITTSSVYGYNVKKAIIEKLEKIGACVSFAEYYTTDKTTNEKILKQIQNDPYLKIVFVWLNVEEYVSFFNAADELKLHNVTWLVHDYVLTIPTLTMVNPLIIHGMVVLRELSRHKLLEIPYQHFPTYFWSLSIEDAVNNSILDSLFKKYKLNNNSNLMTVSKQNNNLFSPDIIVTANNLLQTLHTLQLHTRLILLLAQYPTFNDFKTALENHHKKLTSKQFWHWHVAPTNEVLILDARNRSMTTRRLARKLKYYIFDFLEFSSYNFSSYPAWAGLKTNKPLGKCSRSCLKGKYPIYLTSRLCCFKCESCLDNFIKNSSGNYSCTKCPPFTESNINRTQCINYKVTYIEYLGSTSYTMYSIMLFGISLVAVTFCIITFHKNTPIVKASNYYLSVMQLIAHFLLFLSPLLLIGEVTIAKCTIEPLLVGCLFVVSIGAVFSKTNFLLQIYSVPWRIQRKTVTFSRYKQYLILFIFVFLQGSLFTVYIMQVPIHVVNYRKRKTMTNERMCDNISHSSIQTIFIGVLIIGYAYQAFKVRNLPNNFTDAKPMCYVSFCLGVIFFISPAILSGDLSLKEQALLKQLLTFTGNFILMAMIFSYKCYIILFAKQWNTQAAIRKSLFCATKTKVEELDRQYARKRKLAIASL